MWWFGVHKNMLDAWDFDRRLADTRGSLFKLQVDVDILKRREDTRVRGNKRPGLKKKEDKMDNKLLTEVIRCMYKGGHRQGRGGGSTVCNMARAAEKLKIYMKKDADGNYMEDMVYVRRMDATPVKDGWNSSDEPPNDNRTVTLECCFARQLIYMPAWWNLDKKRWQCVPNYIERVRSDIKILGWRELEKCDE